MMRGVELHSALVIISIDTAVINKAKRRACALKNDVEFHILFFKIFFYSHMQ